MHPTRLVLLHSPLTSAATWGRLPELLEPAGDVLVAEVLDDDRPPYAARYVADAARQVAAAVPSEQPLVLVAHAEAGPLLPQVAFARRAAHGAVGGYVFLDADLPRPGGTASRLDLWAAHDPEAAAAARAGLEAGAAVPSWSDQELSADVPDASDRALLRATARPRGLGFFTEPLPFPGDWPDAPCGFLRTSGASDWSARIAAGRGWPVERVEGGRFAALAAPERTAEGLLELIARM